MRKIQQFSSHKLGFMCSMSQHRCSSVHYCPAWSLKVHTYTDSAQDIGLSHISGTPDKMAHSCALNIASQCPSAEHLSSRSVLPLEQEHWSAGPQMTRRPARSWSKWSKAQISGRQIDSSPFNNLSGVPTEKMSRS